MISYKRALEQTSRFMEETGIRSFCTTICKGRCCAQSYNNIQQERACCQYISCHEKLPCVGYLCTGLIFYIVKKIPDFHLILPDDHWGFAATLKKRWKKNEKFSKENPFFASYKMEDVEKFRFPNYYNASLTLIASIKQLMDNLMESPESDDVKKIIRIF